MNVIPLRTSVVQARLLWDTAFDALALVDDERRYRRVNVATAELFAAEPASIIGLRIEDFTPPEQWPVLERLWGELTLRGTLAGPYQMVRADGVRTQIEFRARRDFAPGEHLIAAREIDRRQTGPTPALTRREREVLQLAADGAASTREIAAVLVVSRGTVKTHLENAYRKLGVTDRASAVAVALRAGLID